MYTYSCRAIGSGCHPSTWATSRMALERASGVSKSTFWSNCSNLELEQWLSLIDDLSNALRAVSRNQVCGIATRWQRGHKHFDSEPVMAVKAPLRSTLPGCVGVEHQNRSLAKFLQLLEVRFTKCHSIGRHCLLDAGFLQRDDIRISLDHKCVRPPCDRGLRLVEAVHHARFGEHGGLRGVEVLGLSISQSRVLRNPRRLPEDSKSGT